MELTPRQRLFVEEYMRDQNGAAAARRAGYSELHAKRVATRLLSKVHVSEAIKARVAELAKASQLQTEDIWKQWGYIARSTMKQLVDTSGAKPRLKLASEIVDDAWSSLKSMKVKHYTEGVGEAAREVDLIEFTFWDKPQVLAMVAKALGMLTEKVDHTHTGPHGGPVAVTATVVDVRAKILSFAHEFQEIALREMAEAEQNGDDNNPGESGQETDQKEGQGQEGAGGTG